MKYFINFLLLLSFSINLLAQAPQAINYQAKIRDNSNLPISDPSISIRVRILKSTFNGTIVFEENYIGQAANNGPTPLS